MRRVGASTGQRVIRGRNGDQLDAADPDALEPRNFDVERTADANGGRAVEYRLVTAPSASI